MGELPAADARRDDNAGGVEGRVLVRGQQGRRLGAAGACGVAPYGAPIRGKVTPSASTSLHFQEYEAPGGLLRFKCSDDAPAHYSWGVVCHLSPRRRVLQEPECALNP